MATCMTSSLDKVDLTLLARRMNLPVSSVLSELNKARKTLGEFTLIDSCWFVRRRRRGRGNNNDADFESILGSLEEYCSGLEAKSKSSVFNPHHGDDQYWANEGWNLRISPRDDDLSTSSSSPVQDARERICRSPAICLHGKVGCKVLCPTGFSPILACLYGRPKRNRWYYFGNRIADQIQNQESKLCCQWLVLITFYINHQNHTPGTFPTSDVYSRCQT